MWLLAIPLVVILISIPAIVDRKVTIYGLLDKRTFTGKSAVLLGASQIALSTLFIAWTLASAFSNGWIYPEIVIPILVISHFIVTLLAGNIENAKLREDRKYPQ